MPSSGSKSTSHRAMAWTKKEGGRKEKKKQKRMKEEEEVKERSTGNWAKKRTVKIKPNAHCNRYVVMGPFDSRNLVSDKIYTVALNRLSLLLCCSSLASVNAAAYAIAAAFAVAVVTAAAAVAVVSSFSGWISGGV